VVAKGSSAGSLPEGIEPGHCVVAYEPIWAIGQRPPHRPSDEIARVHEHLPRPAWSSASATRGARIRLLYGGLGEAVERRNHQWGFPAVDGLLGWAAPASRPDDFWGDLRELRLRGCGPAGRVLALGGPKAAYITGHPSGGCTGPVESCLAPPHRVA